MAKGHRMSANTYKITWKDGSEAEIVTAPFLHQSDEWITFSDGSGIITRLRVSEVKRVDRVRDQAA